ncbi:MAG: hypothetical protein KAT48_05530 [Bacteroidales bacterium]|nr:hypothetical protein [Bacteroidales bacterium]
MKKLFLIIIFCSAIIVDTNGQEPEKLKNWSVDGYVKYLQNVWLPNGDDTWLINNNFNNRLNFRWYPSNSFSAYVGMRNYFVYGQFVQLAYPYYAQIMDYDNGFFDMTWVLADNHSYVLATNIDRANIKYSKGNFEAIAGRQRINWGTAFVWNPNDIFNVYSYFDFDYEERPGSDAIKVEYYTGMASSAQLVSSIDSANKLTLAGMYKFMTQGYDIQFLGGVMPDDIVIGCGWAGQVIEGGFRGEVSYFHPKNRFSDTTGLFEFVLDADYTFKNSLYIHASFLFNSNGTTGKAGGYNFLEFRNLSVKQLSLAKYSLFGQVSYPISPLVNGSLATMFNPSDKSSFVGPSVDISLKENLDLFFIGQLFFGEPETEFGDYGYMWYMRLKWSF